MTYRTLTEKNAVENRLFGISFDGVPMSGLLVEFFKLARVFVRAGHRVNLDLGYELKGDKGNFYKAYEVEQRWMPNDIQLSRCCDFSDLPDYSDSLLNEILNCCINSDPDDSPHMRRKLNQRIASLIPPIQRKIVQTWNKLNVSFVVVENGTLPENIIFTQALLAAIEEYGQQYRLGRYVIWRDHDLMWWSEPGKYGQPPYTTTPTLQPSRFIQYITLHELASQRLAQWSPGIKVDVLSNGFEFSAPGHTSANYNFRTDYAIPPSAFLIARCTRIVPQKCIDRDIHLVAALNTYFAQRPASFGGENLKHDQVYLFIAGNTDEHPVEYERLKCLAQQLGVVDKIIFGGQLRPLDDLVPSRRDSRYSVKDLLAHSQLNSFLTAYDYEGFGNPIAESIASKVPYLSSNYELYKPIYGDKGFRGLLLPVLGNSVADSLINPDFVQQVAKILVDRDRRQALVNHNFDLGRRYFSLESMEQKLRQMFPRQLCSDYRTATVNSNALA